MEEHLDVDALLALARDGAATGLPVLPPGDARIWLGQEVEKDPAWWFTDLPTERTVGHLAPGPGCEAPDEAD